MVKLAMIVEMVPAKSLFLFLLTLVHFLFLNLSPLSFDLLIFTAKPYALSSTPHAL
jgi:hypothetical protein